MAPLALALCLGTAAALVAPPRQQPASTRMRETTEDLVRSTLLSLKRRGGPPLARRGRPRRPGLVRPRRAFASAARRARAAGCAPAPICAPAARRSRRAPPPLTLQT
ncbi:hypothetical protein M885DRAFT_274930 [Pelagophyceae sp. CCMP2097]|nr:hypothetical protein M885DRAFT_274930 [Pelagophyceae sp. CCMP2097]